MRMKKKKKQKKERQLEEPVVGDNKKTNREIALLCTKRNIGPRRGGKCS